MGTTSKTQQTNQYNPQAMQTYEGMQGGLGNMINSYMSNPFGNPFFNTQQQMGTRQAQNLGSTQMSGLMQNMNASGMGGGASSPAGLEMQQNQARANTGMQANLGFLQPVQNALGMQQFAGGLANQYRPLQTGQNQVQSTGGLGTWLPQMLGAGLGMATGGLGGLMGGGISPMMHQFGGSAPGLYGSGSGGFAGLPMGGGGGGWMGGMTGGGMQGAAPGQGGLYQLGAPPPPQG